MGRWGGKTEVRSDEHPGTSSDTLRAMCRAKQRRDCGTAQRGTARELPTFPTLAPRYADPTPDAEPKLYDGRRGRREGRCGVRFRRCMRVAKSRNIVWRLGDRLTSTTTTTQTSPDSHRLSPSATVVIVVMAIKPLIEASHRW